MWKFAALYQHDYNREWTQNQSNQLLLSERVHQVFHPLPISLNRNIDQILGAAAAAALAAEDAFDIIRIHDRRESPGGTWSVSY